MPASYINNSYKQNATAVVQTDEDYQITRDDDVIDVVAANVTLTLPDNSLVGDTFAVLASAADTAVQGVLGPGTVTGLITGRSSADGALFYGVDPPFGPVTLSQSTVLFPTTPPPFQPGDHLQVVVGRVPQGILPNFITGPGELVFPSKFVVLEVQSITENADLASRVPIPKGTNAEFYSSGSGQGWGNSVQNVFNVSTLVGQVVIAGGPGHALTLSEANVLSQIFDESSSGTMTYPAPASAASTYFRFLRNNSSVSITISIGAGIDFSLSPSRRRILTFSPDGVFEYPLGT